MGSLFGRIIPCASRFSARSASPLGPGPRARPHGLRLWKGYTTTTTRVQTPASATATAVAEVEEEVQRGPDIQVFDSIPQFRAWRRGLYAEGRKLGFVPTMGALHQGHLDLVREAGRHSDHVVVSIFVNPAQFAPHEDLGRYPRTLPSDLEALATLGTAAPTAVIVPTVEAMYPSGIPLDVSEQRGTFVKVEGKSHQLEGMTRPQFFRGVATVCTKLFNIVQPDAVFFGQKDIQQCLIIKSLLTDLQFPIQLHVVPTTREEDGLAMSSRNRYLTASQRIVAPTLHRALSLARAKILEAGEGPITREEIVGPAQKLIEQVAREVAEAGQDWEVKLDYLSVTDPDTVDEMAAVYARDVDPAEGGRGVILSGAYWVGSTRLIDNLLVGFQL